MSEGKIKILVASLLILVLAGVSGGVYKLYTWWAERRAEVAGSDAQTKNAKSIRIAGDPYAGYFFFRSPEMTKQALKRGLAIRFTDDGGDYAARLEHFAKGDYDAIVLPINSYLEHGLKYKYPGVIVAAIAESKGADAVLCFQEKLPTGKVTDLNDAGLKIVYTGQSPTSFLIDLAISDFDLFNLKKVDTWRVEVTGSDKAYQKAKKHDGDCFGMWEPDISHALRDVPGLKKVWGSEKFSGYIVDVFVFKRDFVSGHNDDLVSFFEAYFMTMRSYASDKNRLVDDMRSVLRLKDKNEVEALLKEVHWYDMQENASRQFGIASGNAQPAEGILNTILATTDVLVRTGKLAQDPLGGDPNKIINTSVLRTVLSRLPKEIGSGGAQRKFNALAEADWKSLHEVGAMRVEPITFQSGTAQLSDDGVALVDRMADVLVNNYPDDRVVIRGHTGPGSDEDENVKLSQARAEAVMQRLIGVKKIDANRLRSEGAGSAQPPQKQPDENQRYFMMRVPRVEFILFEDAPSF